MKIVKPTQCHLWAGKRIGLDQLRSLKQKAIYEVIDWEKGSDSQYHTYIPIEKDSATIDALNQMSPMQLLSLTPRLQDDWGNDETKKPTQAVWVGYEARSE